MLQYLLFEDTASDGHSLTWEAVASVPPARLPAVLAEVAQVMAWASQHMGSPPCPLDDGGEWDALLEVQADGGPPGLLAWEASTGQIQPPAMPADTRWVAITVTLVVDAAWADSFLLHWQQALDS